LTCCAWLAAATKRCRIGTAVLVLPQRNPLELAKVTASLDRLAGGRLALGVGVGWQRAEMEALGYSFASRGIPILVGGMSTPALRRAAQRGDGWLALSKLATLDLEALAAAVAELKRLRSERAHAERFELVLKLHSEPPEAAAVPAAVREVVEVGFDEVIVEPDWRDPRAAAKTIASAHAAAAAVPSAS
jgi:alkanesulfonate monooxygenase SsuD/methylene tetrahydromethanopterin reductase-like flavin-dependent oxidoreductase (luciferase family)